MGLIFDRNIARSYDSWCRSARGRAIDRSLEQLFLALLQPRSGERILDIGCGHGNHLLIFAKMGLNLCGLDASSHMIEKAGKRLGHICAFKKGIAEDLPFEDNEFDLAVLINTLEFLDEPLQALREAGRVANRKVFVGVINSLSWNGLTKKLKGYLGDPLFRNATFYNLWQLKSLLQKAYGNVPLSWACIKTTPSLMKENGFFNGGFWHPKNSPFGCFLGISATMVPRFRTDNVPLKIRLKKASQSLMGAGGTAEDLKRTKGVNGNERGLPV